MNTTPRGSVLNPLNILSATLGVSNVSFVANVVEWVPDLLYQTLKLAYHHKGFSFVRIVQRCPHFLPKAYDHLIADPKKLHVLTSPNGLQLSEPLKKIYTNTAEHDAATHEQRCHDSEDVARAQPRFLEQRTPARQRIGRNLLYLARAAYGIALPQHLAEHGNHTHRDEEDRKHAARTKVFPGAREDDR